MKRKSTITLLCTLGICAAPAAAGPTLLDFESLNQSEIYGTGAMDTTDLLDTFSTEGVSFSTGVSGINFSRLGFGSNGGGTNGIFNALTRGGNDIPTLSFSMSSVGGLWGEISFLYLSVSQITYTTYDANDNVLETGSIGVQHRSWGSLTLNAGGVDEVRRVQFDSTIGQDLILDKLEFTIIPLPGAAGLAFAGLGLVGARRVRHPQ